MFFVQVLDPDLGCAAYVLGDAGAAVAVDPGLDTERLVAAAAAHGAVITTIAETHVHADHASGRALLAAATGAAVRVPADAGVDPAAGRPLRPGDVLEAGAVRLEALAAPGHRPEHLALLVTDWGRSRGPCLLLTGDSILVGDLARPDLAVDGRDGARRLHATVRRLAGLPGDLELWPGHTGGSLCGGAGLEPRTSSTLGYERRANPLLTLPSAGVFADRLLASLPARPPNVAHLVERNRSPAPARPVALPPLGAPEVAALVAAGAVVIDGRTAEAFDAEHLPGSLNLPLAGRGVGTRAASAFAPGAELLVAAADAAAEVELARRLRAVGLDAIAGVVDAEARAALPRAAVAPIDVADLAARLGDLTLVDVRDDAEWRAGHVPGSIHLPLARLREAELPAGPLAVACAAGNRAAFASSWLRRGGHDARRVSGGGIPDLPRHGVALAPRSERTLAALR